jgi:hypothetical protein
MNEIDIKLANFEKTRIPSFGHTGANLLKPRREKTRRNVAPCTYFDVSIR